MADREFRPDWTVAPAATLRDWMRENGVSVRLLAVAARGLEGRDGAVFLIQQVLDREPLTEDHALVLMQGTGIPEHFWLNYEHTYRAGLAAGLKDTTPGDAGRTPIGTDIDLLCYAAEVAIRRGYASQLLVQRRVRVGFAKAQRLLLLLEEYGITGPKPPDSVKRPALVPESGRRAALAALREAAAKENADA